MSSIRRSPESDAHCSLTLEAHPRLAPIVRLFVGSVAREWGASEGDIGDLRVGAFELAAAAMRTSAEPVSVDLHRRGSTIEVSVAPVTTEALEAGEESAHDVVTGLFDDVAIDGISVAICTEMGS